MSHKQKILIIILSGVILRIIFSFIWFATARPQYSLAGDASSYINTARNFLNNGIWSSDDLENPKPDNFRTPVYPLLLAFFMKFKFSFFYLVLLQDLMVIFSAVLVYLLGRRLFSEKTAFASGLIISISPYLASTFISRAIMTEPLAVLFSVIAFLNFAIYIKTCHNHSLFIGSLFLAVDALTKPQFIVFAPFILIAFFLSGSGKKFKELLISCVIFFVSISPWVYYNFMVLKVFQFSSVGLVNLFDLSSRFQKWRIPSDPQFQEIYIDQIQDFLSPYVKVDNSAQWFEPHNAELLAKEGVRRISNDSLAYVWYHLIHVPRLFYHDTTIETFNNDFGIFKDAQGNDFEVARDIMELRIGRALSEVLEHPSTILALLFKLLYVTLAFFAFLSVLSLHPKEKFFLAAFVFAYAFAVSPSGLHRYRVPIEPFMLLLAIENIRAVFFKVWKKTSYFA